MYYTWFLGEEIREVFRMSGVILPEEELAELIAEADTNRDGVISFEGERRWLLSIGVSISIHHNYSVIILYCYGVWLFS